MSIIRMIIASGAAMAIAGGAAAQTGPVASACEADIAKFCAGKGRGSRQTRTCLESKKDKVSGSCKAALQTTGGKGANRANQRS